MYCTHVACISDLTYSKHKHRTGWLGRPMNMASTSKTPQQCKTWSIALLGGGQTLIKINMLSMVFKYWTITLQEKILLDSTVWNESCWWNIDGVSRGISQLGKIHKRRIRSYVWASCTNAMPFQEMFLLGDPAAKPRPAIPKHCMPWGCEKEVSHSFFDHLLFCIITDMRWMLCNIHLDPFGAM